VIITKVTEGVFRGPQPKEPGDWSALMDLGIKYSLDLETGSHFLKDGLPLEEQLKAQGCGIKTLCHPLGEFLPPNRKELELAVGVMASFQPIYVHCKAGVDRTGMVCAFYECVMKIRSRKEAITNMKKMGMHVWYYWWAWFL
jgi:hypothetical protein